MLGYVLFLNDYLWCSYLLILNFILKIYIFCFFIIFFFILIKSNKQVDTTNPFNKWVRLGLRNFDPFNKHVRLVLTYVVEYSWLNTTRTRHANTNCHLYLYISWNTQQMHKRMCGKYKKNKNNFLISHTTKLRHISWIASKI